MTRKGKKLIPQLNLGKIPSGYISKIKPVSNEELKQFVDCEIKDGPQIVSIPVPPYRHAFMVDVRPDKIMVSDWYGTRNKTRGLIIDKKYENNWEQYSNMLVLLEEKYNRRVEYYPVDNNLYKPAKIHNDINGGGGCSYYIFSWIPTREEYIEYQI